MSERENAWMNWREVKLNCLTQVEVEIEYIFPKRWSVPLISIPYGIEVFCGNYSILLCLQYSMYILIYSALHSVMQSVLLCQMGNILNVLKQCHLRVPIPLLSLSGAKLLINGLCCNATIRLLDLKVRQSSVLPHSIMLSLMHQPLFGGNVFLNTN